MTPLLIPVVFLVSSWAFPEAQVLQVRHDHDPWGRCQGQLLIHEEGIEYRAGKEKHHREWRWTDIQSLDRRSPSEFSLLTYEDRGWALGIDRRFRFSILPEQDVLSESTFQFIARKLNRPVVDRMAPEIQAEYQVQVKHLHTLGGCQGTLYFGGDQIVYRTDRGEDSRTWNRHRDVESVWSLHPYQLEIHAFEGHAADLDRTRVFRFQLKEPLDRHHYARLRREFLVPR